MKRTNRNSKLKVKAASSRSRYLKFGGGLLAAVVVSVILGLVSTGYSKIDTNTVSAAPVRVSSLPGGQDKLIADIRSLAVLTQSELATKSNSDDKTYYTNGLYVRPHPETATTSECVSCNVGPATEAAYMWNYGGRQDRALFQRAHDAFNYAIAHDMHSDGSMGDVNLPDTQFYANQLASIYLQLAPGLDGGTKTQWQASIRKMMDYMVNHGDYNYYTNGNIELGKTLAAYKAFLVTNDQKYNQLFEKQYSFTVAPPQTGRSKGFGLIYTNKPTKADGSDGAGFLAEVGSSGVPGYDGDYTQLSASLAAEWFQLSGDPRALRLTNLLANRLLNYIDQSTWVLDATKGTRHQTTASVHTSAYITLAWIGGRSDLLPKIQKQFTLGVRPINADNATKSAGIPGATRDYGLDLSTLYALSYR